MQLGKLMGARRTVHSHSNEAISAPLAYKLMKFMKASDEEGAFYAQKCKEIIAKYEDKETDAKENDGNIRIKKDKIQDFKSEMSQLENTEVETPAVRFSLFELNELKLSVTEVFSLDELIIEEE